MKLGIAGMGRMGANMARRLKNGGHDVCVFDIAPEKTETMVKEGFEGCGSPEELVKKLDSPRIIWVMLPAGNVTGNTISRLKGLLEKGDIIIEGGNSYYKDDIKRAEELSKSGIEYVDAGVSGGIWGLKNGYAIMAGGKKEVFGRIEPLIKTLAPENGYMYCGSHGAGHFVKMIHNGIEYAIMEAYGEGFGILKASEYGKDISLEKVAGMWNAGSVVKSWLLELLEGAFKKDSNLENIQGYVGDSGEARWTVKQAVDTGVAADVIAASLFKRFNSRQKDVFADKVAAALRNEFGGHAVAKQGEDARSDSQGAGEAKHAEGAE